MSAPQVILDLVARFEQQLETYKSGAYNETQLRRDFLDPFFKALGWDMDNEAGYAEAYRDVIHEDTIRIGGVVKAPDYSFRIGGARKFFLEAKKPAVDMKADISPAYQLRRYGWNAKLALSLLSDFEELAVYDCRVKPGKNDPASTARVFYCAFRELAEKWDWLASIFSRDAVLKGSFDKFAETNKAKRGTTEVDADFLASMETWRNDLARNLALRNPRLSQRELNFAVQRILDRIIFLRICEDRGLEDYGRLLALTNAARIYPRLCQHFEQADTRYNSGLFHFKPDSGRHEPPDELTLGLEVDDALLRDLFKGLYYPDSPYEFSLISADILGQVYEQFLGKVIRLTEGHRAVVDEKPEVRKAGGVYYTPTYVAEYIVRQTVGRLVEEIHGGPLSAVATRSADFSPPRRAQPAEVAKTPGVGVDLSTKRTEVRAPSAQRVLERVAQLRILDPACGSGSFLICAYQFLLDWHLQFYLASDPEKWAKGKKPALVQTTRGWRLAIAERKRILLNNIYGVDIDPQAVEVTKLSLLLKVLEGETSQSIAPLFSMFHERALPDLGDNIKCGNSLIGPDFYQQAELPLLTGEEKLRLNVFDWHAEFPHIFRRRRGNEAQTFREEPHSDPTPPLFLGEGSSTGELQETPAAAPLDYTMPGVPLHGGYSYKKLKKAKTVAPPTPIEPEWEGGFDAVIGNPPYVLLGPDNFEEPIVKYLRRYEVAQYKTDLFHLFIEKGIKLARRSGRFGMIVPNTWLTLQFTDHLRRFILANTRINEVVVFEHRVFADADVFTALLFLEISPPSHHKVIIRLPKQVASADDLSKTTFSTVLQKAWVEAEGAVFEVRQTTPDGQLAFRLAKEFPALDSFARASLGCQAYNSSKHTKEQIENRVFHADRKLSKDYLPELAGKDVSRYELRRLRGQWIKYGPWLHDYRTLDWLQGPRILIREITGPKPYCIHACYVEETYCHYKTILNVNPSDKTKYSMKYFLGLLNSRLISFIYPFVSNKLVARGFPRLSVGDVRRLPIRPLDLIANSDRAMHDRMVSLVDQMLDLHRQLALARTPHEQTALERQIAATDTQIDRLVYQLYGLTEEEIQIVEGDSKTSSETM